MHCGIPNAHKNVYIKTVYLGRHVSTFTGSSSGPQRTQIQDYIVLLYKRIVGSQMLTKMYILKQYI